MMVFKERGNQNSKFLKLKTVVSIGEQIRQTLKERRKTVVWFAAQLACSRTNVYKIFSKSSIDTNDLLRISKILNFDFFEAYSKQVKKELRQNR